MPEPDEDPPRWSSLPHDPFGFFGVGPGVDPKELRRRYNAWIRRFRPERHPEEFERIRAAYELCTRMCAGGAREPERASAPGVAPAVPGFDDVLRRDGVDVAFAWLRARPALGELDHVRLAVLSDVATAADRRDFAAWLATGLERWPRSALLAGLLTGHLEGAEGLAVADRVLPELAARLAPEVFTAVTVPAWRRLLAERPFADVERIHAACRLRFAWPDHPARLELAWWYFRFALFVADDDWLARAWTELTTVSEHSGGVEQPITELLREYRAERATFVVGHPIRDRIDRALVALAHDTDPDPPLAELLGALSEDVLRAFRFDEGEHFAALTLLRHATDLAATSAGCERTAPPTAEFVRQLGRHAATSSRWRWHVATRHVLGVGLALILVVAGALLCDAVLPSDGKRGLAFLGWLVGVFWIRRRFLDRVWARLARRAVRRTYEREWRGHVFGFLVGANASRDELVTFARRDPAVLTRAIAELVDRDPGIGFGTPACGWRAPAQQV